MTNYDGIGSDSPGDSIETVAMRQSATFLPASPPRRRRRPRMPMLAVAAAALLATTGVAGGIALRGVSAQGEPTAAALSEPDSTQEASLEAAEALAAAEAAEQRAEALASQAASDRAAAEAAAAEAAASEAEQAKAAAAAEAEAEAEAAPAAQPPATTSSSAEPPPADDMGGYTKADYEERLGDIPIWIAKTRDSMSRGYTMSVGTGLSGLANRFDEVGRLPCPGGIEESYWYGATQTLADFSRRAAEEWRAGAETEASARFEVIIDESNKLIDKTNKAMGLQVKQS